MAQKKKSASIAVKKRWTPAEERLMRRNAGKVALDSLAQVLERSRASVQFKGWQMGLSMRFESRVGKRPRLPRKGS